MTQDDPAISQRCREGVKRVEKLPIRPRSKISARPLCRAFSVMGSVPVQAPHDSRCLPHKLALDIGANARRRDARGLADLEGLKFASGD